MASKRVPMEDPPSASSDEESSSEEISDKEDVQTQERRKENQESEEEESSEEQEDEEVNKKPSSVNKPNSIVAPQPQSDSYSEESDSETLPSPTASDFTVKPIVSKPMANSTNKPNKSKKSTLKAPNSGSKRPAEGKGEGEKNEKESHRKKIKVSNRDLEEKKYPIQRLWSEDDEIVILKGMIDYQSKKGADPNADMSAFHDVIKKSLHVDVSRNQLMDKVRRLKKKYKNNVEKNEKGENPIFSKPHEHKSFDLSKKIWGDFDNKAVIGSAKSAKNDNKKARKSVNVVLSPTKDGKEVALDEGLKGEVNMREVALDEGLKGEVKDVKVVEFWSMYPRLKESLEFEESSYFTMSVAGKSFMKERMSIIGSAKAKELEEKWTNLCMEEVSLYMKRADLIKEQAKTVLDAMKASGS